MVGNLVSEFIPAIPAHWRRPGETVRFDLAGRSERDLRRHRRRMFVRYTFGEEIGRPTTASASCGHLKNQAIRGQRSRVVQAALLAIELGEHREADLIVLGLTVDNGLISLPLIP